MNTDEIPDQTGQEKKSELASLLQEIESCVIDVSQGEQWKVFFALICKFRIAAGKDLMPYKQQLKLAISSAHNGEIGLLNAHKSLLRHLGYHKPAILREPDRITSLQLYRIFSEVISDVFNLIDYNIARISIGIESLGNTQEAAEEVLSQISLCTITQQTRGRKNLKKMFVLINLYRQIAEELGIPHEDILERLSLNIVQAHKDDLNGVKYHKALFDKMIYERRRFKYDETIGEIVPRILNPNLEADVEILQFTNDVFYTAELVAKAHKRESLKQREEA